jgi:hypothetical protein
MTGKVVFPICVRFEDGTTESYDDVESLETDLEVFDSESSPDCEVTDALGRRVRLKVDETLVLRELSLADEPPTTAA